MSLIRARFLTLGAVVLIVGATRLLKTMGIAFALEDCLFAATLATMVVAAWQRS